MCLIVRAWRAHPDHPLIVAANRDEFHARPASPAAFWPDRPQILAGRDLKAKGTWMGISRSGRFAAVTNFRGATEPSAPHSRGALVSDFLDSSLPSEAYVKGLQGSMFSGFNLLVCDGLEFWSLSNRDGPARKLAAGIHGLGNTLLDAPEVERPKARFRETAGPALEPLFCVLAESKIVNPVYGTRCSTVFVSDGKTVRYAERSFSPDGEAQDTLHYEF